MTGWELSNMYGLPKGVVYSRIKMLQVNTGKPIVPNWGWYTIKIQKMYKEIKITPEQASIILNLYVMQGPM